MAWVTAVAWVKSLTCELPHDTGAAKNKQTDKQTKYQTAKISNTNDNSTDQEGKNLSSSLLIVLFIIWEESKRCFKVNKI